MENVGKKKSHSKVRKFHGDKSCGHCKYPAQEEGGNVPTLQKA